MKRFLCFAMCGLLCFTLKNVSAQQTWPVEGLHDKTPSIHAFVGATIIPGPGQKIDNGTIVIRDGVIEAIGKSVNIPREAVIHDLKGMWIYPGLIDAYAGYGIAPPAKEKGSDGPQPYTSKKGAYSWNQAVKPEFEAAREFTIDAKRAGELRALGFTTVHARPLDGIVRGTGAIVNLGESSAAEEILSRQATANFSFDKGVSTQDYPSSLIGTIALIRQTFYDASWYGKAMNSKNRPDVNISLDALNAQFSAKLPLIFEVANTQDIFRVMQIGKEFGQTYIIKSAGYEYERIEALKQNGVSLIVPVNFPSAYDVEDPDDANNITLAQMKKWEWAPANPGALAKAGIIFALTSAGLQDNKSFWPNIHKSVAMGLPADKALEALTTRPAKMLGIDAQVGTLEKGKLANMVIASGNLFEKNTTITQSWIKGRSYEVNRVPAIDPRGVWNLQGDLKAYVLMINGTLSKLSGNFMYRDSQNVEVTPLINGDMLSIQFRGDSIGEPGLVRLKALLINGRLSGTGEFPSGKTMSWSGTLFKSFEPKAEDNSIKSDSSVLSPISFPNMAFGLKEIPEQQTVLIRNATVWTNTAKGILKETDVLFEKGEIKQVGKNLSAPAGAWIVDGTGKHVTTGIIDEHSHIAVSRGVNEGTQSVSSEVRIGDALDAEDSDIYRQLAGGVTSSHLLHGSANAIGGQTQLIKLRWGAAAEELKFPNWPGFIKFALGENVKQSNWGDDFTTRYPQTRMGVEQIIRDAFQAAKEYKSAWESYQKSGGEKSGKVAPRRDLELDALVEILDGKRHITCHSYVQSEITMLMRVAEEMGFRINTFTHILEGYKVADKMKKHGAAGSTFADWWAYKYEVIDAIPHNPGLMHQEGVTVGIN
ncbi:MAG TPA: amidohydrolase family protein, partial [bacterium]|nr:amidohydrolase family protein [bacterium]